MRYLATREFWNVGYWVKPTQTWQLYFESRVLNAPRDPAAQWEREVLQFYYDQILSASERGEETGIFPICASSLYSPPQDVVYTKPILLMTNEFSVSAGDAFPAMFKDAGRGPIVGYRTGGLGGNVNTYFQTGITETQLSITRSLLVKERAYLSPEHGMTRFVENAGVQPDVVIDFMTRENLLTGGRAYVQAVIAGVQKLLTP